MEDKYTTTEEISQPKDIHDNEHLVIPDGSSEENGVQKQENVCKTYIDEIGQEFLKSWSKCKDGAKHRYWKSRMSQRTSNGEERRRVNSIEYPSSSYKRHLDRSKEALNSKGKIGKNFVQSSLNCPSTDSSFKTSSSRLRLPPKSYLGCNAQPLWQSMEDDLRRRSKIPSQHPMQSQKFTHVNSAQETSTNQLPLPWKSSFARMASRCEPFTCRPRHTRPKGQAPRQEMHYDSASKWNSAVFKRTRNKPYGYLNGDQPRKELPYGSLCNSSDVVNLEKRDREFFEHPIRPKKYHGSIGVLNRRIRKINDRSLGGHGFAEPISASRSNKEDEMKRKDEATRNDDSNEVLDSQMRKDISAQDQTSPELEEGEIPSWAIPNILIDLNKVPTEEDNGEEYSILDLNLPLEDVSEASETKAQVL